MLIEYQTKFSGLLGDILSAENLFFGLAPKTEKALKKMRRIRRIRKGAVIFYRGQKADGFYVQRKGRAQLFFVEESSQSVRMTGPGEILGITETIAGLPYQLNLKTLTPCSFDFIAGDDFLEFLQREPEFCFHLVKLLSLNLQKSHRSLCCLIT